MLAKAIFEIPSHVNGQRRSCSGSFVDLPTWTEWNRYALENKRSMSVASVMHFIFSNLNSKLLDA